MLVLGEVNAFGHREQDVIVSVAAKSYNLAMVLPVTEPS
jgi:hypothetical protein